MDDQTPEGRRDVLLAVGLSSRPHDERRVFPDRRSGIERRKHVREVSIERRSGVERRRTVRRRADREEGSTLLEKADTRVAGQQRQAKGGRGDGLR